MAVYYVKNGTKVKKKDNIQNRQRKEESDLRINRVVVHVTKTEKEIIFKLAKENGMDTSTFIRCLCLMKYREMTGELVK
ncbi:CopG family transcriptional regulator [Clostridium sp. HMSC19A10]|uniref:plasmid mobilization protein n=1 Tax=Clostridium TaxID=1485 RepID=UPI0008A528F0|nr:CopG family transcriptional regulator [Clostridium sp. HMSC19A10]OFS21552.1 CopG family transcriptional regulator [Clostridium sp. HMSC19A10]